MQTNVQFSLVRRMTKVACANESGLPDAVSGVTDEGVSQNPSGTGIYAVYDSFDSQLSMDAGVPRTVLVCPYFLGGNGSYTLAVYGLKLFGSVWHPILLYKADVTCDLSITGDEADDSLTNDDKRASVMTQAATIPAGGAETTSFGTGFPANAVVATRGCPFLYVTAGVGYADAGVMIAPLS